MGGLRVYLSVPVYYGISPYCQRIPSARFIQVLTLGTTLPTRQSRPTGPVSCTPKWKGKMGDCAEKREGRRTCNESKCENEPEQVTRTRVHSNQGRSVKLDPCLTENPCLHAYIPFPLTQR